MGCVEPHLDAKDIAWLVDRPRPTVRWWIYKGWLIPAAITPDGRKLYSAEAALKLRDELAARQSHEPLDKHPDQRQH